MDGVLIETCWQIRGRSEHIFMCALYCLTSGQIEVRVLHANEETPVFAQPLLNLAQARQLAQLWLDTLVASGTFSELRH